MVEYRNTLTELETVASAEYRALREAFHNSTWTGLEDGARLHAGDPEISQADFELDIQAPLHEVILAGVVLVEKAKLSGFHQVKIDHIYRFLQSSVANALATVADTEVERGGPASLTIKQLQLDTLAEQYVRMQVEVNALNGIAAIDLSSVAHSIRVLSANPALQHLDIFASEIHRLKISHPELLIQPAVATTAELSAEDLVDLRQLLAGQQGDWLGGRALTALSEKVQPKEDVIGTDILMKEGQRLTDGQVNNLRLLLASITNLQESAETNPDVFAQRGLSHFAAHPERLDELSHTITQILDTHEQLQRPEISDPSLADWQEFVRDIRVDGISIADYIPRFDLRDLQPEDGDRFRRVVHKLEQVLETIQATPELLGRNQAQQRERLQRRSEWLEGLIEKAKRAIIVAETGVREEQRRPRLFEQFLKIYAKTADGQPLSDEIIYGTSEYADEERQRATMRWAVSLWHKISDRPSPFLNFDFMKYELGELHDGPELVAIAESVPEGMSLYRFFFGVTKVISLGSEAFKTQQNQEKLAEIYSSRTNRLQMIEHILRTGHMGTGALPMGRYTQVLLQAIIMHDPADRAQYRPVLEEYLGTEQLDMLFPPDVDYPTYNGQRIDDLLVQEEAKNSAVAIEVMTKKLAAFLMQWDQRVGGDPQNPLSEADALFVVATAINTAEFLQIIAALDNRDYVSKRFTTRLKFLKEYRSRKYRTKQLGSPLSINFFRTLQPEITEMVTGRGVDLENVIMMTGTVDAHPDLKQRYLMERVNNPNNFADPNARDSRGPVITLDNLDIRREHWELAPFEFGQHYVRTNRFTKKFYDLITWNDHMVKDWFSGHLPEDQGLRKVHNDNVGYYFGDFERPAPKQRENEADQDYYDRIREERMRWANKGYVLVKGYKVDPNNPGMYLDSDGHSTPDPEQAKTTWAFTPALMYFHYFDRDGDPSPDELLAESIDRPVAFQQRMERRFTKDSFTRMRLEFTKWLVINEIAEKNHEFQHKDLQEKIKILGNVFACLCQDVFSARYLKGVGQVFSGESDHVEPAGFGQLTVDDVVDILERAEWLRPGVVDIQLRTHINTVIRPKAYLVQKSGLRPRLHH